MTTIEALTKQYPDVPVPLLVKTEGLRRGVRFTPAALQAIQGMDTHFKGYFLFSYDRGTETTIGDRIPAYYHLSDGACLNTRVDPNSPYAIDRVDDRFMFCDDSGPVEEVTMPPPPPRWLNSCLEDGTPLQAIAQPAAADKMFCTINYYCEYWSTKEQCLFCDIVSHLQTKRKKEARVVTRPSPEQVARVLEIAFRETGYRHLALTAGTVLGKLDGRDEIDLYCEYLNAIKERFHGVWWSAYFQVGARERAELLKLYETGIPSLQMNMEVWDPGLWETICPGKAHSVGREEWLRRMFEAAEVFGKGRILSNFVSGVEMAQPFGFKTAKEAVESTLSGFDYLMAHGVLPRMDMWYIEDGSGLSGQSPPPLEYYVEIERGYLELRQKHGFSFPYPAYCRGCTAVDTLADWDYYFVKLPEMEAAQAVS